PDLNSASTASLYDEKLEYDKNGNILKLDRNGASLAGVTTLIDKLTYGYESGSNRLSTIRDASGNQEGFKQVNTVGADYAYDEFGNLISDKHKKITKIKYNHLNLPVEINFGIDKIEYLYTASGEKTQKKVTEKGVVTLTDYLGGFQYVKGKLSFLPTAEGFFNTETNAYVYQYKDHLGNVRLSYSDKNGDNTIQSSTEIIEETNYYPFGLVHKGYNQKNDALMKDYKYQYNGKEKQEELGLNFYDYGARNYDAAIGRWMNVDPLAEAQSNKTPYHYVSNNPITRIDPTGMLDGEYDVTHDKDGKEVKTKVSTLGDEDGIDFNHQMDGSQKGNTQVVNHKTGKTNWITNGVRLIRGYTQRDNNTDWSSIYNEWKTESGPQNSLMYGRDNAMNKTIRTSNLFGEARNNYLSEQAFDYEKKIKKGNMLISFANYLPALRAAFLSGNNMTMQMMGTVNVSFYNIGNFQRLVLITDSKSVESFNRLGSFMGYKFSDFLTKVPSRITRQTYIWIDHNIEE
ncbi:MAG: RHS repeat-associated core domain-containing protein, partial [Flavobacteriaceae bacterium]|nr:RHS repeat-associated core domain-containing protein [Flavobacteriaceae bacterium]